MFAGPHDSPYLLTMSQVRNVSRNLSSLEWSITHAWQARKALWDAEDDGVEKRRDNFYKAM